MPEPYMSVSFPDNLSEKEKDEVLRVHGNLLDHLNDPEASRKSKDAARAAMRAFRNQWAQKGVRFDVVSDTKQSDPTTGEVTGEIRPGPQGTLGRIGGGSVERPLRTQWERAAAVEGMQKAPLPEASQADPPAPLPTLPQTAAPVVGGGGDGPPQPDDPNPPQDAVAPTPKVGQATTYPGQPDAAAVRVADALHDPTPLNPADPKSDLVKRLTDAILAPQQAIPGGRPFTAGEHIALGILGGLDPDAFKNVVMPLLEAERQRPRQQALDAQAQQQQRIQALEGLARLQESVAGREQSHEEFVAGQTRLASESAQRHEEFLSSQAAAQHRFEAQMAQQRELKLLALKAAGEKLPAMTEQNHIALLHALDRANEAQAFFKQASGSMLTGGAPGGKIAGHFLSDWTPGGADRAKLAALFAPINDSILKFYQRRGLSGEALQKINSALPDITMQGAELRNAIAQAVVTLNKIVSLNEKLHPMLRELREVDPLMGGYASPNPPTQVGDIDLNLDIPDDEVQ